MANIYHPKGSMCSVCVNKDSECSKYLDFTFMPVMKQYKQDGDTYKVIKCGMFNKANTQGE